MKTLWEFLNRKLSKNQAMLAVLCVALAVVSLGAASVEQLSVDYTTRACAQAVNFTGTFQVASVAPASANTASAIVKRDSSGNFSAGTITAALTGNASGSAGSCTGNAATVTTADTTDTTCYLGLYESVSGSQAGKTDLGATYDASTGTATFTAVAAALTGNVTGNCTGSSGTCTGNAGSATYAAATSISLDTTTVAEMFPLWATATTGNLPTKASTDYHFNPSTGMLTVTGVTSTVTGNCSGTSANVTGTVAVANGGTGAATAALARTALSAAGKSSGTLVAMPLNSASELGDIYIDTGAGDAYISCTLAADTTGWKKVN